MSEFFIGLMSGTSMDGVDGVLADFSGKKINVRHYATAPFPAELKAQMWALNSSGADEIHHGALAANALVGIYTQVVQQLLQQSGLRAEQIRAIGAHGQTVRHRPGEFDGTGYTIQLNNPALLAERCGIAVVADFRSRDVAAGGQGAPLVPAFHRNLFASDGRALLVLNIGGISNISVLHADGAVLGFDCGPGNALMDDWCLQHTGQPYDDQGAWAASGTVLPELLARWQAEPFFALEPPKSTGRDLFNRNWLQKHWEALPQASKARPQDIQATLTELTASACADCATRYGSESKELLVCGGGALNSYLMRRLQAALPQLRVLSTAEHGMPPLQVEAAAFAWLARQTILGLPGNLPRVTGARGLRVLGAIYPA